MDATSLQNSLKYSSEKVQDALRVLVKDKRLKQNEDSQLLNYHSLVTVKIKAS
jgi:hypothetical protein